MKSVPKTLGLDDMEFARQRKLMRSGKKDKEFCISGRAEDVFYGGDLPPKLTKISENKSKALIGIGAKNLQKLPRR